jgi:hypothetical protein
MPHQPSMECRHRSLSRSISQVEHGGPENTPPCGPEPVLLRVPVQHRDEQPGPAGEIARSSADDWTEESCRQAAQLARTNSAARAADAGASLFLEFRRKLASGEALSRALARLAMALRFSGRITISFHQGRVTKTACEEMYLPAGTDP